MDEVSCPGPRPTSRVNMEVPPATPVVEATPPLSRLGQREGSPILHPQSNIKMAEVNTSAIGDKDVDPSGDSSLVHKERLDASPAFSAHVVLDPHA